MVELFDDLLNNFGELFIERMVIEGGQVVL